MEPDSATYVISVLAQDRVGIIADVSNALFGLGANIEAISQTVVGHYFTMVMRATFPAQCIAGDVRNAIESQPNLVALVMPYEASRSGPSTTMTGEPFVVTVVGGDRPGIVRGLTRCFAQRKVNIEDVWNEVRQDQFIVIFKVTVPHGVDPKELRYDLEHAAEELGVSVRLQHQDLFTATNSLSVHSPRG
ncbi:MAG TPA: ACT domain-containing protein [Candidatus Hydrogenedentes bacterium]|nr:ACT domain-containing protein [Candidatus Hydrogenedentota bacterium]HOS02730.1 ACT domain-containing protein [Candidatus Hydrogenedentota bacterium]